MHGTTAGPPFAMVAERLKLKPAVSASALRALCPHLTRPLLISVILQLSEGRSRPKSGTVPLHFGDEPSATLRFNPIQAYSGLGFKGVASTISVNRRQHQLAPFSMPPTGWQAKPAEALLRVATVSGVPDHGVDWRALHVADGTKAVSSGLGFAPAPDGRLRPIGLDAEVHPRDHDHVGADNTGWRCSLPRASTRRLRNASTNSPEGMGLANRWTWTLSHPRR